MVPTGSLSLHTTSAGRLAKEAELLKLRLAGLTVFLAAGLQLSAGAAAPAMVVTHHPRVVAGHGGGAPTSFGWSSSNWSGYAKTGGPFTSATGSWKVPAVTSTRRSSFSSSWVGIDGFNNANLIQTGTEQDWYNGSAHYNAWWEILPAPETPIGSITVHPGDTMTATISRLSGSSWSISIKDVTTNQSFSTTQTYAGPLTSVEWIQEAPTVNGRIATLAHYGKATFDPGTANGASPQLVASQGGTMVQGGVTVSTPSNPDSEGDGYTAAYGKTQPAPPSS
jgi:Peptidase A4 family